MRAALSLLSAAAAGASEETGVLGAVAIELVHNFSLIHDDIIDGDTERRHRSTVWSEFGIGQAIIVGDALATLALQVLLDEPTRRAGARRTLPGRGHAGHDRRARPTTWRSSRGRRSPWRSASTWSEGRPPPSSPARSRWGRSWPAPPTRPSTALADFGSHLGTSFQAVDDLLGIWGEPAAHGQASGERSRRSTRRRCRSPSPWPGRTRACPSYGSLLEGDLSPADMERARVAARRVRRPGRDRRPGRRAPRPGPGRARPGAARARPKERAGGHRRFVTERDR